MAASPLPIDPMRFDASDLTDLNDRIELTDPTDPTELTIATTAITATAPAAPLPRPTLGDLAPALRAPAPLAATSVALVTLAFGIAFLVAVQLPAVVVATYGWLGIQGAVPGVSVAGALLGGLLVGTPLAAQVLHRQLARPLGAGEPPEPGTATRYAYSPDARRRMAVGLAAAYATAALLALGLARATSSDVLSMLSY
jgi:hypothetical protein